MLADLVPQISEKAGTYTATDLVTILAAVGVLVGSIVTGIVTVIGTLRNGQKTQRLSDAVIGDATHPGLIGQVKEVHTLTNANMTAANNKIDKQTLEIRALLEMVQDLRSERNKKDLAVAKATVPPEAKLGETIVNVDKVDVQEFNVPVKEEKKK